MKRRWLIANILGIILIFNGQIHGFEESGETSDELSKLISTIENFPRATIPELEELDQLSELEEALDNEDHSKDQEYAEKLLKAIRSVRERYDELREKWNRTIREGEEGKNFGSAPSLSVPSSFSPRKKFGPLSRARALSSHTIFQKPIAPPTGWADFENDAEFEEISAPDMKIPQAEMEREMEERATTSASNVHFIPKIQTIATSTTRITTTTTTTTPTTTTTTTTTSRGKAMRNRIFAKKKTPMRTTTTTSTTASTTTATTTETTTTTRTTTATTTTTTITQTPVPTTTEPLEELEFSTSLITTNRPITIGWKSRNQPPPPRAPITWTSHFSPKTPKEETKESSKEPTQQNEQKQLAWNDPRGIEAEIGSLMDLWERGPLSERLKAADDQRIERLISRKDLDRHAKNILLGKRRLRRLLILSRLFEDRSRILILVEAQRHALRETIKRAQNRIPKSVPKSERKDSHPRQVSRSRVNIPPSEMFETRWPAVRESFSAPVFNPSTDTLDTAVERGFVETDPEFFGRRPRRKLNRIVSKATSPLLARLLKVQNRKGIDERNAKIISLRGGSSQSEESGRRKGPLNMNNQRSTVRVRKTQNGESREKSDDSPDALIETVEKTRTVRVRSSKPDPNEITELCQQIECDFEKGDLCNWESSADQLDSLSRRQKREEEFSIRAWSNVGGRPDRAKAMERNPIFSSINTHFAGAYVNGSQVATLSTRLSQRIPVAVRFLAWEATRMVRLRMCCDDFCPFSTEEGVTRGHRKWIAHTVICPAHTKQITFECVNTGEWSGRCGLDSIHFHNPRCADLLPYTEDEK